MAETIIAFKCQDFVMVAGAGLGSFYYIKITDNEDKITQLDSHKLVACAGENGPRVNFVEFIKANIALRRVREHGRPISTPAAANLMRQTLAQALRSEDGAYLANCLLAGYDTPASENDESPPAAHLFYLDYLGTLQAVPYGCHGYGTTFVVAMLDRLWRPDLTAQEGLDLMQKCCNEVKHRIIFANNKFFCKVITAKGVEAVPSVS